MKRIVQLTMAAALAVSLVACGGAAGESEVDTTTEQNAGQGSEEIVGGWEVNGEAVTSLLTPDQAEVFEKAMSKQDGLSYEPVAVVGQQVVAGMNYAYLARSTGDEQPTWNLVVIYAALDGSASFTSASPLDLGNMRTIEAAGAADAVGAWEVAEPTGAGTVPDEVTAALEALAAEGSYELVPQALLGSQVVAGTNYQLLCIGRPAGDEDARYYAYDVIVYVDLEGKAEVTSTEVIDVYSYVSPAA